MANKKANTSPATSTPACTYCNRPAIKQIRAAQQVYCGKLCAALGLIVEVHNEDGIHWYLDFLEQIVSECACKVRPIPIKVREIEGLAFHDRPDAKATPNYRVVIIDDDGTPDWEPDKATAAWCRRNPGECLTDDFLNARALLLSPSGATQKARNAAAAR